jgi:LssY-like putative type I secretion system component LssY
MLPIMMLPVHLLLLKQVPAGTPLHVRLTTAVGSYESKPGMAVRAVLIAPVVAGDDTLIPAGSTLTGEVTHVNRVGFGIVHETAALALDFSKVTLPDGASMSISTRLRKVDNGREHVARDGNILGVRTTNSISYRATGYIRTLLSWEVHARLASWAIRMLFIQVPEPEIYYPSGSELTLGLTEPMWAGVQPEPIDTAALTWEERGDLAQIIENVPDRTYAPGSKRPADLVNMMFIGSRDQVADAFKAAGWTETSAPSLRTRIKGIRAVAEFNGYVSAPMTTLLVNDAEPDLYWEKGLNDFAKRDHIRMWKQPETWNGQEVWIGAATRDVDYAYMRPGHMFTHQIEQNVDRERDKIAHDLEFTSCTDAVNYWERPGFPRTTHNATGDLMVSDARLAVVRLNGCGSPRPSTDPNDPNAPVLRAHGGKWQRFARREVLSVRDDFYRGNIIWRSYEGAKWTVALIRNKRKPPTSEPAADFDQTEAVASSNSAFSRLRNSSWLR